MVKKIIIDGVDVSKCNYFNNTDKSYCEECCSEFGCAICNDRPNCYYKQLKRKEQELQAQRNFTTQEQRKIYCAAYDKTCETGNECKQKKCAFKDRLKYKQALAEIEKQVKAMNNECFYSDFDCMNCDMQNGCTYFNKKQILQKINECEVENENS